MNSEEKFAIERFKWQKQRFYVIAILCTVVVYAMSAAGYFAYKESRESRIRSEIVSEKYLFEISRLEEELISVKSKILKLESEFANSESLMISLRENQQVQLELLKQAVKREP